jgi:hypothetical protein
MNRNGNESLEKMHTKILKLGLAINIFLPLVIFFLVVYLRDRLIQAQTVKNLNLFFYVLLAISLSEVAAIFIIKKQFSARFAQKKVGQGFSPAKTKSNPEGLPYEKTPAEQNVGQSFSPAQEGPDVNIRQPVDRNLLSFVTVIFALCFSPTIYGLVYYILGGTWEHFALFVAITFLFFQLFKPKMEELEKLSKEFNTSD